MIPVNTPNLTGNEAKYLAECIETGWISSEGPFVKRLEDGMAEICGRRHGIAVCNGSVALDVAVAALGIGPGDEVILPTFTIISCALAIVRAGAIPVVVDSDPATWNMDVAQIEAVITPRTKAIMAVHIYGLPVDMEPLIALAQKYGLYVIEDAAEVIGQTYGAGGSETADCRPQTADHRPLTIDHGNEVTGAVDQSSVAGGVWKAKDGDIHKEHRETQKGLRSAVCSLQSGSHGLQSFVPSRRPCGSLGHISTLSFYPNKHVTTGEGGMVLTDDPALAEKCRGLRNLCFGKKRRFVHEEMGWNFRMSNLQAAIGVAQLERLDASVKRKREIGLLYQEMLQDIPGVQLPLTATSYADNIYWVFGLVLQPDHSLASAQASETTEVIPAERAMKILANQGIGTRPFFWPMHEQPVFHKMGLFKGAICPNAEYLARNGFYIPSGLALTDDDVNQVGETVRKCLER